MCINPRRLHSGGRHCGTALTDAGGACMCAQVSDLTGSFRLYRKSVLQELVKDVASKGCAPETLGHTLPCAKP